MKTVRQSDSLYGLTRANDVWYRLREDILAGVLLPDQRLRFEKLRAVYDVSYATLREALSKLAYEGLVIADARRGFMVAPICAGDLADLTSVRIMIETETLKRSIAKGDAEWRSSVLAAFHKMDKFARPQISASRDWAAAHREFHSSLVAACDSPLLLEYRGALFDKANRYRRLSTVVRPSNVDRSNEHRELMEAVLARNADYACTLVARHIQQTTDDVLAAISNDPAATDPSRIHSDDEDFDDDGAITKPKQRQASAKKQGSARSQPRASMLKSATSVRSRKRA